MPNPVRCRCQTRWVVNFGDDRRTAPTDAMTAATASGLGLTVRLADVSTTPMRPIVVPGMYYGDDKSCVSKLCRTCGWPVETSEEVRHVR